MLSTTGLTKFLANRNSVGAQLRVIVKLTDGTSTWYFSQSDAEITEGHVYGILLEMSGIQSQVDPITKAWSVGDVNLTLANTPYRDTTSGRNIRPSDELSGIVGRDVYIYLSAGVPGAISDCLQRFHGRVAYDDDAVSYDDERITIKCIDKTHFYNRELPPTLFTTGLIIGSIQYPLPSKLIGQVKPLVYGTFAFDIWNQRDGTGLIKGFALTDQFEQGITYPLADHALLSIGDVYFKSGDVPLLHASADVTEDLANGSLDLANDTVKVRIFPEAIDKAGHGFNVSGVTNGENMIDRSASTYGRLDDYHDDGFGEQMSGICFEVGKAEESVANTAMDSNVARGLNTIFDLTYKIDTSETWNVQQLVAMYSLVGASPVVTFSPVTWDGTERTQSEVVSASAVGDTADQLVIRINGYTNAATADDGIENNQDLIDVYRLAIDISWAIQRHIDGQNPPTDECWATGEGMVYDTWIDDGSRSNSKNAGDLIDNISGVVESLLTDRLSVPSTMIDYAAFDACIDALGTEFTMQLLKSERAFDIIRKLMEQSPFMFVWSANSKAKMIDLRTEGTTVRTIPLSHIVNGKIKVGRQAPYATNIEVKSRYVEFYGEFMDTDTGENSTTDAIHDLEYKAEWPYISGTAVDDMISHVMGTSGTTGLMAQPHNTIEFETFGFTNADLENGDWIELEAASVDGQTKLFGASWSGKKFIVRSVDQQDFSTKIRAIQLF